MHRRKSTTMLLVSVVGLALAAACSTENNAANTATAGPRKAEEGFQQSGSGGDITRFCGTKPMKVGFLKSAGGNTWVLQAAAEFKDEAAKCGNVTEALFAQAINDQQKAISDITSYVAQGVNVLVISADYGVAELPAISKATQAGVKVVTILGDAGGKPGTDFVDAVTFDTDFIGKKWADFLHEQVGKGTVAFLGGTPGNETSTQFFASFQEAMKAYPEIEIVDDRVQDTNWDPALRRKVMTGLLSKHGRIDAIVSDFNGPDTGAIQAYDSANMERPVVASITSNNEIGCDWAKKPYPFLVMGQTSSLPRLALRIGVAAFQGTANTESAKLHPEPFTYLPNGTAPDCKPALPPDADLTADLTESQLTELFKS
ncbi:substrate-binding domain-containing protein [Acrocarpospora sp. B8E8]|uniref:substrate-binding domain-containing protein n=1 Tax=Acrocarpospora sp. B8E8 TaxID=3153572 RepID=UPI00325EF8DE